MDYFSKIIIDIEIHSAEGIQQCFEHGVDPNGLYRGRPLIYELFTGYLRSPVYRDCVRVFVDHGLNFGDPLLLAIMLDDAQNLENQLIKEPDLLHKKYTLDAAFTPLYEASLLHLCAEYNHLACAKVVVEMGLDVI